VIDYSVPILYGNMIPGRPVSVAALVRLYKRKYTIRSLPSCCAYSQHAGPPVFPLLHKYVGILGAVGREGRNSRLLHYHETSGLAQTREEHQEIGESSARPRFDNAKSCLSVCHMLYVISDLNHNEKTGSKITKIR
jgi:hypothetical protein